MAFRNIAIRFQASSARSSARRQQTRKPRVFGKNASEPSVSSAINVRVTNNRNSSSMNWPV